MKNTTTKLEVSANQIDTKQLPKYIVKQINKLYSKLDYLYENDTSLNFEVKVNLVLAEIKKLESMVK